MKNKYWFLLAILLLAAVWLWSPVGNLVSGRQGALLWFNWFTPRSDTTLPTIQAGKCPSGFSTCGGWCCYDATQQCANYDPWWAGNNWYCQRKPGTCGPNEKRCPAKDAPACCDKKDSCGLQTKKGFQGAVCVQPPPPGGCRPGAPGYCGEIDNQSLCCTSPMECIIYDKWGKSPKCQPASCPAGEILCSGTITGFPADKPTKICCAGACFSDPNGSPNCNPPPPTTQPTSQPTSQPGTPPLAK